MSSDRETYHFRIDGSDPFDGVLEAIQFVKGRDAMEIEPIGRVVDPDAIRSLLSKSNGVSVTFIIEDLEVEVTSAGDIYIADPTPESFIHESVADESNLLLETRSHDHEACVDLLSVAPYDEERLLGVLHAESFESRVSAWDQYMDQRPAETAAINVGDFPRSSAVAGAAGATRTYREPLSFVPDATDLATLRARITDRLAAFEGTDRQLVVCFDSVTELVRNAARERALAFLRDVIDEMEAADAVAHYHFDPEPFSEETTAAVTALFDSSVVVHADGDWTVQ